MMPGSTSPLTRSTGQFPAGIVLGSQSVLIVLLSKGHVLCLADFVEEHLEVVFASDLWSCHTVESMLLPVIFFIVSIVEDSERFVREIAAFHNQVHCCSEDDLAIFRLTENESCS